MEPPYDVSFSIALGSFSGSAVVVEAYGTVSGYPGRLRVPVVFPAGATNGVAGVCGESGASPAWSTRSFYEFYRQDAGWDFLYKFEVDHAGAGAAILDVADGLRCVAQGADSALYRLERPLVFLPAPVESTATAPGAASLRGPGILFVDPADVPVTGTYAPEGVMGEKQPMRRTLAKTTLRAESSANGESPGESSDTLFPVNLRLSDAGDALPDADERWRGVVVPVGNSVHFIIEDPFGMEEVPDDAVLTLSKTSDAANAFPAFQTVSWTAGEVPENWLVSSSGPGVAVFELSLDGTDVHSKDRVRISVVGVDLDIDSDNDGDIDSEDDEIEDSTELPGKALFLNELDTDKDGLPDFADGFNCQFHNTIQSADAASKQFAVMTVNVGSPSQGGKLVLKCDVADGQAGLHGSGSGTWNQPYTISSSASSKKIRIWTKDGNQKRSRDPFPDGDLIVPGQSYDIQQIAPWGTTNFYIEAIHGSDSISDVRISAELRSDETDEMVESDAVRATVFHIEAVHPIAEDFGSNAGKIMIATRHDDETPDRYYTTAITTAAGTPAQTSDRTVTVSAYVLPVPPTRIGTLQVFFEVTDPDDRSHYEGKIGADGKPAPDGTTNQGNDDPNDNRDPARRMTWNNGSLGGYDVFQQSCLSDRSAIPDLETIDGVQRYVAETTLTITDRHSGDNYCVRATLQNPGDKPFDTVSGMTGNAPIVIPSIKATRNLVAWRRYYLRRARMYTKGCTIVDENPSGKATVSVDSVSDVSVGEWVTVFWRGGSCERRIRSITSGTTIRLEGGDGSGAEPIYLLSNGSITHVGLADKGSGYTDAPSVVVEGGNPNNPAIIKASLQPTTVGRIVMTSGGSGYTSPPTVMYNGDGIPIEIEYARAHVQNDGSILIENRSFQTGYTFAPDVTITGGGGTGAAAVVKLSPVPLSNLTLSERGAGYGLPTITFETPLPVDVPQYAGIRPFGEPEPACFPPTTGRLLKSAFGTSPDGQEGGAFIEFSSGSLDDDYIKVPKYECFRLEGHAPFSRYWFGEETIDDRQNICVLDANAGTKEKSIRSTEAVDLGGCTQGRVCAIFNGSVKGSRCRENSLCHEIGHRLGLNYSPSVPWQKHIDGMIQTPSHRGLAYDKCVMSYLSNKMDNNVGFCIDCLSHQTENRFEVGLRCTEE